jgi:hypothetical protein
MVRLARLERATLCLEGRCSIHLSYRRTREKAPLFSFIPTVWTRGKYRTPYPQSQPIALAPCRERYVFGYRAQKIAATTPTRIPTPMAISAALGIPFGVIS